MASRQKKEIWHCALANRIRALRKAAGLTQEQLSERADIGPEYVSRLETARQVPSLDTIIDLAEGLNVTPSALLAEPQTDARAERMNKVAAIFSGLAEEDAAFLESQLGIWASHVKRTHGKS